MALIKCPDCGKEHSDLASACPNCARPSHLKNASSMATENITKLGTKWLTFYSYTNVLHASVWLFAGFCLFVSRPIELHPYAGLLSIAIMAVGAFPFTICLGLIKRELWAWRANWFLLIGALFFGAIPKGIWNISTSSFVYPENYNRTVITNIILIALFYLWPNYVYFTKRKCLFEITSQDKFDGFLDRLFGRKISDLELIMWIIIGPIVLFILLPSGITGNGYTP